MRLQSSYGCRRITLEIVIRSIMTEGRRRYGRYWIIEVLNHLGIIESSVIFFSSVEVGTNGYEFSLYEGCHLWTWEVLFLHFYFNVSCFTLDMLRVPLLTHDLGIAYLWSGG